MNGAKTTEDRNLVTMGEQAFLEGTKGIARALQVAGIPETLDWGIILLEMAAQLAVLCGVTKDHFVELGMICFRKTPAVAEMRISSAVVSLKPNECLNRVLDALEKAEVELDMTTGIQLLLLAAARMRYPQSTEPYFQEVCRDAYEVGERRLHKHAQGGGKA